VFCSFGSSATDQQYCVNPLPTHCHSHYGTKCTAVATKYT